MKLKIVPFIVILVISVIISSIETTNLKKEFKSSINGLKNDLSQSISNSNSKIDNLLIGGADSIIDSITIVKLSNFNKQLDKLIMDIKDKDTELNRIKESIENSRKGLPDLVDLDQLNDYYSSKFKNNSGYEQFQTSRGVISFHYSDFDFVYARKPFQLAYLRVGKTGSTLNAEMINAWLNESAKAKTKLGYRNIYSRTRKADYGEYTEKMYEKGDLYFKTYFQYERVQGTYDRHSLQYNFYVETGSKERNARMELQQYVNKLGS